MKLGNWKQQFETKILRRGEDYYYEGAVQSLDWDGETITATVCGTDDYAVEIDVADGQVTDMFCSCPYAEQDNCKHMAAVLLAASQDDFPDNEEEQNRKSASKREGKAEEIPLKDAVKSLKAADARELLLRFARVYPDIAEQIMLKTAGTVTNAQIQAWKKRIISLTVQYSDRHGFIDYQNAHSYTTELQSLLDEKVPILLDCNLPMEAFELTCKALQEASEIAMDDSDGGLGELYWNCAAHWREILPRMDRVQRHTMFEGWTFDGCSALTSITIPGSVSSIGRSAFADCDSLRDVYYTGNQASWEKIQISKYNDHLLNANVHYLTSLTYSSREADSNKEFPLYIQWDWNLFDNSPAEYNNDLAIVGLTLSRAAEHSEKQLRKNLKKLGFESDADKTEWDYFEASWKDIQRPAYCFSYHWDEAEKTVYFLTVIRGTHNLEDWATDATGVIDGFLKSAENISKPLDDYINRIYSQYNPENMKFFFTGHSLGGAVADILAYQINAIPQNVFAYTFAAPKHLKSEVKLPHIHNIINEEDVVPMVPTTKDYRYGVDIPFHRDNEILTANGYHGFFFQITGGKPIGPIMNVYNQPYTVQYGLEYASKWLGMIDCAHSPDTYLAFLLSCNERGDFLAYNRIPSAHYRKNTASLMDADTVVDSLNVEVYAGDGNILVGRVTDGVVDTSVTKGVSIDVDDDGVHIYFLYEGDFTVKATGSGQAEYSAGLYNPDTGDTEDSKTFSDVHLSADQPLSSVVGTEVQAEDVLLLREDSGGRLVSSVDAAGTETEIQAEYPVLAVETVSLSEGELTVTGAADNFTGSNLEGALFCSVYQGGQMYALSGMETMNLPNARKTRKTVTIPCAPNSVDTSGLSVKLFLLDENNLFPLSPCAAGTPSA